MPKDGNFPIVGQNRRRTTMTFSVMASAVAVIYLCFATIGLSKETGPKEQKTFNLRLLEVSSAAVKQDAYAGVLIDLEAVRPGEVKLNDLTTFVTTKGGAKIGFKYLHIVTPLPISGVAAKMTKGSMEGLKISLGDKVYNAWSPGSMALSLEDPSTDHVTISFEKPAVVKILLVFKVKTAEIVSVDCAGIKQRR